MKGFCMGVTALALMAGIASAQTTPETVTPDASQSREANVEKLLEPGNVPKGLQGVVLSTKDNDIKMLSAAGSVSATYAFVTVLIYDDFPDLHASLQINDARPTFHLRIGESPNGRVFLVKAKSNDGPHNRSVKIGTSGFGRMSGMTSPDPKWVIPWNAVETSPGNWTMTLSDDLPPGDYGIYTPPRDTKSTVGGELYGFEIVAQ